MVHFVVSLINLAGKVLALWKIVLFAAIFGASKALDAFYIAYALPFVLPELFKSIISTAFIPRFMRRIDPKTKICTDWQGANTIFTLYFLGVLFATAIFFAFANEIIYFIALGAEENTRSDAVKIFIILSVIMPLLGINGILTTLSHSFGRFFIVSTETVVVNIFTILALIFLVDNFGVYSLVYGIVFGFIIYTLLLVSSNFRLIIENLRFRFDWKHTDVSGSLKQMVPLLVGQIGAIAVGFVDLEFASFLAAGAISAMNYAMMLALLPLEVFGNAIITTHYPKLSKSISENNREESHQIYRSGIKSILFYVGPICLVLVLFSEPIIRILFMRGEFDAEAASLTSNAMVFFSLAVFFRSIAYYNYRVLHAANMSWSQITIGLIGVGSNIYFNYLFIDPYGLVGIAFATTLAVIQNLILSSVIIYFRIDKVIPWLMLKAIFKFAPAIVALSIVALICFPWVHGFAESIPSLLLRDLISITLGLAPAAVVYLALCYFLGFEDAKGLLNGFGRALKTLRSR